MLPDAISVVIRADRDLFNCHTVWSLNTIYTSKGPCQLNHEQQEPGASSGEPAHNARITESLSAEEIESQFQTSDQSSTTITADERKMG